MPRRPDETLAAVGRGLRRPVARFLGWLFVRVWVEGGRYGCFNQQPYLHDHPTPRARSTGFEWALYQVMLSDRARVEPYRRDIEASVRGRTVLEVGPGPTAVLTRIAARAGAARIVSVEANRWVAASAARHLRRHGIPESRVAVVTAYSDDLTPEHTGGVRHFDVLLVESYHAIASQERVVETIDTLRAHGFTFDQVISRGFTTWVAPARAPRPHDMTAVERVLMRWPAARRPAARAMRSRASSLHGDVGVIESLRLAPGQEWQACDVEAAGPATTAGRLSFEVERLDEYAGWLFWNHFRFHGETLDTLATPTCWGVYFVPLPIALPVGTGAGAVRLTTEQLRAQEPSALRLTAEAAGRSSRTVAL